MGNRRHMKIIAILILYFFFFTFNVTAFAIPSHPVQNKIPSQLDTIKIRKRLIKEIPPLSFPERSRRAKKILANELYQPKADGELNHCLESLKKLLGEILDRSAQGQKIDIHLKYLHGKYASLQDLDKQVRNNYRIQKNKLKDLVKEKNLEDSIATRLDGVESNYLNNITPILKKLEDILQTTNLEQKKEKIKSLEQYITKKVTVRSRKTKQPSSRPPAFRPSKFKPIKPDTSGKVIPAYLSQPQTFNSSSNTSVTEMDVVPSGTTPTQSMRLKSYGPQDLAETIDIVITQEMRDLADSLNNSPIEIYQWVKDNIEVEFYYGSLKGSVGTYLEKAGNDTDTASLFLALLRAANIPCRYVTGTIEIPIDQVKNLTGVEDPTNVGDLIASAGIPGISIVGPGGQIVSTQMEHTWVEALVDYFPYTGAKAGGGDQWIPLSPALKDYEYQPGIDLVQLSGFNTQSFLNNYISTVRPEVPVDLYKSYFENYLKINHPGMSWQVGLRTRKIKTKKYRTLPATVNFNVLSINGEYAQIPDNLRHKVSIIVPEVGLSHTLDLPSIVGKKVTYCYPPATATDKAIIESNGGIENTPPLAVNLIPSLKVEGTTIATGDTVRAGYDHTLRTSFFAPGQADDIVDYSVISGAYYAVGLDPQMVSGQFMADRIAQYLTAVEDTPETLDNMDQITGEALYLAVMKYFLSCNSADEVFANILQTVFLKQTSGAITGKNLTVYTSFGQPSSLAEGGYFVDAARNVYTPMSIYGDASKEMDFMLLGGYHGSYEEHNLFEKFFHLEAISTMKLLTLANDQGMPIYNIDSSNIWSILPQLGLDASVKSSIQSSVNQGHIVKIHRDTLTVKNWSGAGYIDLDPTTNAAGYMISGGWAGGCTIDPQTGEIIDANGNGTGQYIFDGEPVNVANGNLFETEEDFTIPSRGMPIEFKRYYNSQSDYNGPFGYGWTHTYNQYITENVDESVTCFGQDGSEFTFTKNQDGTYKRPPGFFFTLTKEATSYKLRDKHGLENFFDLTHGKIMNIVDRNGNTITFEYTEGNLTKITDTVGRDYILSYNEDSHITSITTPGPYQWAYTYDNNDNFMSVTRPGGYTRSYTYYADHNLASLTNARGATTTFDYYSNDKVHLNQLPNGGTFVFSYNHPLRITTVTDSEENITAYYYNQKGAVTGEMDTLGYEEYYTYDEDLNRIKIVDKNGGIIKNIYDSQGNLLSKTDQENYTFSYTYGPCVQFCSNGY